MSYYARAPEVMSDADEVRLEAARDAIHEAWLHVDQAVVRLIDTGYSFREAGMPRECLAARNAAKQLEAFQTDVLERGLGAKVAQTSS